MRNSTGEIATNAGYYKGQYQFESDETYSFKGESCGGYSCSEEIWTIEERGTYQADDKSLTIIPRKSEATLRDRTGDVSSTKNNELERVTYRWSLHYFEGLNETNLVLQPARQTMRDGGFSGNSDFPRFLPVRSKLESGVEILRRKAKAKTVKNHPLSYPLNRVIFYFPD